MQTLHHQHRKTVLARWLPLLGLLPTLTLGNVFYVDGNVETSGDGLSWATAKQTIQEGLALLPSNQGSLLKVRGDQLYFVGNEGFPRSGASVENPIILRGVPGTNGMGRLPIIHGSIDFDTSAFSQHPTYNNVYTKTMPVDPGNADNLAQIWEGPSDGEFGFDWDQFIEVDEDPEVDEVAEVAATPASWFYDRPGGMLYVQTSDGTHPDNFILKNARISGVNRAFLVSGRRFVVFERFEFRHHRNGPLFLMSDTDFITFRDNHVYAQPDYGVEFHSTHTGTNCAVYRNVFELNNRGSGSGVNFNTTSGGGHTVVSNQFRNALRGVNGHPSDCVIAYNTMHDLSGQGMFLSTANDTRIFNNRIFGNAGGGIRVQAGTGAAVYNNTVLFNGTGGGYEIFFHANTVDGRVFNNIVWADGTNQRCLEWGSAATGMASDYNLLYATDGARIGRWDGSVYTTLTEWQTVSGMDADSISADPRLVDVEADDLRLDRPSPARDAGTAAFLGIDAPADDFEGNRRPLNAGVDIGAYEYPITPTVILIR